MFKQKNLLLYWLATVLIISGCPVQDPGPGSTPLPTQSPSLTPIPVISTAPILGDYYKIEFGPGSKGVSTFGPGSKGVSEFGPGSKGVSNLRFNVNIPSTLVRNDLSFNAQNVKNFSVKQAGSGPLQLGNLTIIIQKDNKPFVRTTLLPVNQQIIFTLFTDLPPGTYSLFVMAENNFEPLQTADLIKLESNLEVKIVLYDKDLKRENLDIAIRTKPIQPVNQ
jgi:hypothetical protein